ncbi:basic proline-rich protein-like [Mastomys coucha]|uniref:basic proline-rich protein-like n=1 Tax=Mastomys coucha TaxID=35658 RepID=UPI0012621ED9|nr:basic proline-rich protein-like [Mastomys coucha]
MVHFLGNAFKNFHDRVPQLNSTSHSLYSICTSQMLYQEPGFSESERESDGWEGARVAGAHARREASLPAWRERVCASERASAARVPTRLGLGNGGALAGARGQVRAGRHPGEPWGGRGVSGPGGPPGAGGRGSYSGARLRSASGPAPGPASPRRLTPLPPGSRPAPARVAASLAARLGPSSSGTPRSRDPPPLPVSSSPAPFLLPGSRRLPLCPPPLPAAGAGASRERRGVHNPFPPPPPLRLSGAVRGWRAAVSAGGGEGGETRRRTSERAERGHTAALRPTGEEQPRRSPPREGGWAAAWGGVSRPPQWLPRSQVDLRPRPGAATSAAPPPRALQDAAAPARTPEPTGAGASPAPLRELRSCDVKEDV